MNGGFTDTLTFRKRMLAERFARFIMACNDNGQKEVDMKFRISEMHIIFNCICESISCEPIFTDTDSIKYEKEGI